VISLGKFKVMTQEKMLTVEGNWDKNFVRLRNKLQAGKFFLRNKR